MRHKILISLSGWLFVLLFYSESLPAQDKPLAPVVALQSYSSAITSGVTGPQAVSDGPVDFAGVMELTGRIRVVRDDDSYKVKAVVLDGDDGNEYNVLLDSEGKKLVKVLKSRIVRVTGEIKEKSGRIFLAVKSSEIIGSARKPPLVTIVHKPEFKAEPQPVVIVEPKPPVKPEPIVVRKTEIVTERKPAPVNAQPPVIVFAPKPEPAVVSRQEIKLVPKPERKVEGLPEVTLQPKVEHKTDGNAPEITIRPKTDPKPEINADVKPGPMPEQHEAITPSRQEDCSNTVESVAHVEALKNGDMADVKTNTIILVPSNTVPAVVQ